MNEYELLEKAAKAAGISLRGSRDVSYESDHRIWNPRTDDGDAFRLAVKLRIRLVTLEHEVLANYGWGHKEVSVPIEDGDAPAAARLAILLAAAAIGEAL